MSNQKIDEIIEKMEKQGYYQGQLRKEDSK